MTTRKHINNIMYTSNCHHRGISNLLPPSSGGVGLLASLAACKTTHQTNHKQSV